MITRSTGATVLAALLAAACGTSPTQPTPFVAPPSRAARISRTSYLGFGDSITAGTTSPALTRAMTAGLPQSYPYKLLELLTARYADQAIAMENAGLPAETAADGVRRFPSVIQASAPEVVILLHGVNDVTFLGLSGVRHVAGYLKTMAQDARAAGTDVILCTLPPQRPGGFRAADPAVIVAYNNALREVATVEGAILVDFERDVDVSLIGADGLHPTEAGYARMAQILFDTIRSRFEIATTQ